MIKNFILINTRLNIIRVLFLITILFILIVKDVYKLIIDFYIKKHYDKFFNNKNEYNIIYYVVTDTQYIFHLSSKSGFTISCHNKIIGKRIVEIYKLKKKERNKNEYI